MHVRATQTDQRKRPVVFVRLQQRAELHRRYVAQIPWWRRSLLGYLFSVPLVSLGLLVVLAEQHLLPHFYFPGTPMILFVLLVALIWGVGPALFCVLLSTLVLDYFYVSPTGRFGIFDWPGLLLLLPFIVSGLIVAIIVGQRESARRRALFAEQEVQEHAYELEQLNAELTEANQLKDRFISMASHELKTPITSIRGNAQITLRRLTKQHDLPPELLPVRAALQKIDEQTYRLNALVEDLLELSSIHAGKVGLRVRECDLAAVCTAVVEDQRLLTERTIELEVPAAPVKVRADADRLSQVVANLVSNALKYSPDESPVRVNVSQQEHLALIQVHDCGPGISKEQQAHIFEAFYRTPDAQSATKDGWGLGLAICKDIVERHGGRIWCESQPEMGTTFVVELPALT